MVWLTGAERRFKERAQELQTGPVEIHCSRLININASDAEVWSFLLLPGKARFTSDNFVFSAHLPDSPTDAIGEQQVTVHRAADGRLVAMVNEVVELVERRRIVWKSLSHLTPVIMTTELLPTDEGHCVLRTSAAFSVDAKMRLVSEEDTGKDLETYLRRVKDLVESQ